MIAQTDAALQVLGTTPGVGSARALTAEEQRALLEPWFGPDLPVETLPMPQLIEIIEDGGRLRRGGPAPAPCRRGAGRGAGRSHPLARAAGARRRRGCGCWAGCRSC